MSQETNRWEESSYWPQAASCRCHSVVEVVSMYHSTVFSQSMLFDQQAVTEDSFNCQVDEYSTWSRQTGSTLNVPPLLSVNRQKHRYMHSHPDPTRLDYHSLACDSCIQTHNTQTITQFECLTCFFSYVNPFLFPHACIKSEHTHSLSYTHIHTHTHTHTY